MNSLINSIHLEPIKPGHLDDMATLHYKMLKWSFNGQLGVQHIKDLYSSLLANTDIFGFVYYHDDQLIGFTTATTDSEVIRGSILKVYRKRFFRCLLKVLMNPQYIIDLLESKYLVPRLCRRYGTKAEWLTFVTDTTKPLLSPVVAIKLIDSVHNHFKRLGVGCYMAQGVKNNPKAMAFYRRLGWKLAKSFHSHNVYLFECSQTEPACEALKSIKIESGLRPSSECGSKAHTRV